MLMSKMILSMFLHGTMPPVTSTTYTEAKTGVFWDVEECPIPEDLDPESVYQNIRSALANNGYHGEMKIMAFGDRNQIPGYYESAGIEIFPKGDKSERIEQIQLKFFGWMRDNKSEFTNMMVTSRSAVELGLSLLYEYTYHNILFADPLHPRRKACGCRYGADSKDPSAETWVWETLAAGGDPINKADETEERRCKMEGNHVKDASVSA